MGRRWAVLLYALLVLSACSNSEPAANGGGLARPSPSKVGSECVAEKPPKLKGVLKGEALRKAAYLHCPRSKPARVGKKYRFVLAMYEHRGSGPCYAPPDFDGSFWGQTKPTSHRIGMRTHGGVEGTVQLTSDGKAVFVPAQRNLPDVGFIRHEGGARFLDCA